MFNIISFLLIVVSSLICMKSADMPNQLLDLGILILSGYSFSVLASHLKLPEVTGYVIAGMILSPSGLGFLDPAFSGDMTLIEGVFFMMLISQLFGPAAHREGGKRILKLLLSSAFPVTATALVTFALVSFRDIPLPVGILFGLFAASFSPAMFAALERDIDRRNAYRQFTMGAYITAFVLFSFFAAYCGPRSSAWWKLALAPLVIALTSVVAGIVWSAVIEKMLYRPRNPNYSLFPFASLFLIYPFIQQGGLDVVFVGAGIGLYNSLFSERQKTVIEQSKTSALIVFTLFGTRLSLEDAFLLNREAWIVVGILLAAIGLGRVCSVLLSNRLVARMPGNPPPLLNLLPYGPLSLVFVHRFGPAFVQGADVSPGTHPLAILTTVMMIIAAAFPVLLCIWRLIPYRNKQ